MPATLRAALDDERLARAAWSRLAEPGDGAAAALVGEVGAALALEAVVTGRGPARWRSRLAEVDPAADVAAVHALGGRLVVPGDEEWPSPVDDLARDDDEGHRTLSPPLCLWVRGPLRLDEATRSAAALVGTRTPTGYGEHVAAELGAGLADRGFTVWSGGAYGIDAVVHRAALAVGGRSVAVLACGVDRAYPAGNSALIARLVERGAVVSEVPPNSVPTRWRFLERNRLIAAATRGTVVVEAAWRSGALATADRADKLLRPVGAVPGPVDSAMSAGCHRLLRERGAVCITRADEAAELLGRSGEHPLRVRPVEVRPLDGLDPTELRVAECLPRRASATTERIARDAGLDVADVQAVLGRLELTGIAGRTDGGWVLAVRP